MKKIKSRPDRLWTQDSPSPTVQEYIDAYMGEFDTDYIESAYPYSGKASAKFRRVTKMSEWESTLRFEGRGPGVWTIHDDHSLNDLTADLLAAGDLLSGVVELDSSSASPGGTGVDSSEIWIPLMDGGVGAKVRLSEDQWTNRVRITHRTTIRGPRAYRALLEVLGFDWRYRKLYGEESAPKKEAFLAEIYDDS